MKQLIQFCLCLQLSLGSAWAQTLNETFDNSSGQGLTDQEQTSANNYYHQGIADRVLQEQCKKLKTGCDDRTGRPGNVLGGFEEVLPRLYAVMGTLAAAGVGNKIKMNPARGTTGTTGSATSGAGNTGGGTNTAGTSNSPQGQTEQRTKTDVCIYIPLAGEAISTFTQTQAEQQIQQQQIQNQRDLQREALYAVARTQNARAKTAKMQASIYAATGACYVAYMAMGASLKDPMLWVKMGAATAMSAIFFKKAGNHSKYAGQLKEIADKLPGAGECNPFTSTNCFCAEKTSYQTDPANFNRFCVPQAIANNGPPGTQVACATINTDGTTTIDAACRCKQTNTCANAQIRGLAGQLGLGSIAFQDPINVLDNTTGSFNEGTLDGIALGLNAANTRALTGSVNAIPNVELGGPNKAVAEKIAGLGVPSGLSSALANQAPSSDLPPTSADAPLLAATAPTGSGAAQRAQLPGYNAAGGSRPSGGQGEPEFVNPLAGLTSKGESKPAAVQVETFAERAIREAEITRDTSRNLFEVISNRYRANGWGQASNPTP